VKVGNVESEAQFRLSVDDSSCS